MSIANLQQLSNSKVIGKQLTLSSAGEIKAIQISSEKQEDQVLTVNIKVDIVPECNNVSVINSLSLW